MSERERVQTRNFRHPIMEIPAGTRMESPTGIACYVAGRSAVQPGKLTVVFEVNGRELTQHVWPTRLRGFKVNGEVLR